MRAAGQDTHLFILESHCAEPQRAEKNDSGMYTGVLNSGWNQGVGGLSLSSTCWVFLMLRDTEGIYCRSRRDQVRLALSVQKKCGGKNYNVNLKSIISNFLNTTRKN